MVTPAGSLKDCERETTGGGGGGGEEEGAALLLLFRAARWDHWTFWGVREGGREGGGEVKQADNTVRHEGRCVADIYTCIQQTTRQDDVGHCLSFTFMQMLKYVY